MESETSERNVVDDDDDDAWSFLFNFLTFFFISVMENESCLRDIVVIGNCYL